MTLQEIREELRIRIGDVDMKDYDNNQLNLLINRALDQFCEDTCILEDKKVFTTDGSKEYTLPTDIVQIMTVELNNEQIPRVRRIELENLS